MVISGGNFKPDTLKPKEVVSLLLDDEELEKKCMYSKLKLFPPCKRCFSIPTYLKMVEALGYAPWVSKAIDCIWGETFFMLITCIKTQTRMCYGVEGKICMYFKSNMTLNSFTSGKLYP